MKRYVFRCIPTVRTSASQREWTNQENREGIEISVRFLYLFIFSPSPSLKLSPVSIFIDDDAWKIISHYSWFCFWILSMCTGGSKLMNNFKKNNIFPTFWSIWKKTRSLDQFNVSTSWLLHRNVKSWIFNIESDLGSETRAIHRVIKIWQVYERSRGSSVKIMRQWRRWEEGLMVWSTWRPRERRLCGAAAISADHQVVATCCCGRAPHETIPDERVARATACVFFCLLFFFSFLRLNDYPSN